MGTPVQAGEPEVAALAKIAGRERAGLPPEGIPVPPLPGISVGTVRKHLETIFTRLGVSSRTTAVACAFPGQVAD